MQIRTYIEDAIDIISVIFAAVIGFAVTILVQNNLDQVLLEQRGKKAFGGEYILYVAVLAIVTFVVFEILTNIGHKIHGGEK